MLLYHSLPTPWGGGGERRELNLTKDPPLEGRRVIVLRINNLLILYSSPPLPLGGRAEREIENYQPLKFGNMLYTTTSSSPLPSSFIKLKNGRRRKTSSYISLSQIFLQDLMIDYSHSPSSSPLKISKFQEKMGRLTLFMGKSPYLGADFPLLGVNSTIWVGICID